ncbi:alpha-isopropylmalate synthase regulatory domain-containing protein [Pseudogracilibacillus sp. SO30301A]|uniref:alpha-isopropylmalate synthase regulatory domain-containing protein n=1 Tax=Pseudogracilibacillus sp. SO30301A TaxID=3098291 RepID=UPI003FA766E8
MQAKSFLLFQVQYGSNQIPTATIELQTPENNLVQETCTGSGSVEAFTLHLIN